ncbi:hypothetical protein [Pseudomonas sp. GL-B-12]|uniref:hypothetical protein n=1 Tax=Pseudomonas sp. GL-B-12 TaxID=2832374 RepID=UPI001CBAF52F|nr:hypothetical protein [Pseudomonas sp. GL-B-12]
MSLEVNTEMIFVSMYSAAMQFSLSLAILNEFVEIFTQMIRKIIRNAMSKGAIANSAPPKWKLSELSSRNLAFVISSVKNAKKATASK